MYKANVRPILFLFNPELVHSLVVGIIKATFLITGVKWFINRAYTLNHPKLERNLFGLRFKNPVGLAGGFDKNASFYNHINAFGFGFIEVGTVTPKPQPGNPKPRLFRLIKDNALINRMGFNNNGLDRFKSNISKRKKNGVLIGANIGKNTLTPNESAINDFTLCFKELYDYVDYFVVNISCPNIANLKDLQDKGSLKAILAALVDIRSNQSVYRPILLKISPDLNQSQIDDTLDIIQAVGIDGVVATNTTTNRDNLTTDSRKIAALGNGGLSGRPLTKRSTEVIRYINKKTQGTLPIIASGGVMNEADALEKLNAGATLVQVYTGFIYEGPGIAKRICKALMKSK